MGATGTGFMGLVTTAFNTAVVPIGTIRRDDATGKTYMFCQAASTSGAIAVGGAVYQLSGQSFGVVTDDIGNSTADAFVGLSAAVVAAASNDYFWVQIGGLATPTTVTNAAFAFGDLLVGSSVGLLGKAQATGGAAITGRVVAVAMAAKATAGATVSALLI